MTKELRCSLCGKLLAEKAERGDGDNLRPLQDAKRPAMTPVKWARKGAMEFPGVTFTAVTDRRRLSFRYEDGTLHREERIAPVDHRGYAA